MSQKINEKAWVRRLILFIDNLPVLVNSNVVETYYYPA